MNSSQLFKDYQASLFHPTALKALGKQSKDTTVSSNPSKTVGFKHLVELPDLERPGKTRVVSIKEYESGKLDNTDVEAAVILRHEYSTRGDPLRNQLEIHSEVLRDYIRTLGRQFRHLNVDANPIVISYPFDSLFFLKERFEENLKAEQAGNLADEIRILLDFIESKNGLADSIKQYHDLVPNGRITWFMLWSIYPPLELVYHREGAVEQCFLVEYTVYTRSGGQLVARLNLVGGGHNGKEFGIYRRTLSVPRFSGEVQISTKNLPIIPMRFIEEKERKEIEQRLKARGQDYISYQTCRSSYKQFQGKWWARAHATEEEQMALESDDLEIETNGRIMIDAMAAAELADHWSSARKFLSQTPIARSVREYKESFSIESNEVNPSAASAKEEDQLRTLVMSSMGPPSGIFPYGLSSPLPDQEVVLSDDLSKNKRIYPIEEEDKMLCPHKISAFLLDRKKWIDVLVSNVHDIDWLPDPYVNLQLNQDKKKLILSLLTSFATTTSGLQFDDIIRGKGRGLIFLLFGPPGTGKTFTAETVAEQTQRPLYYVTAGELSTEVARLESELLKVFKLGWRWGAVLLIDEADVLMSRRDVNNLDRSAVVAVFLRLIEYYQGLLFLTTNQEAGFDNAILNRIHIQIEYQKPDSASQRAIWYNLLHNGKQPVPLDSSWDPAVYEIVADLNVTGRQIRNLIRTAYEYARYQAKVSNQPLRLAVRHVQLIIRQTLSQKTCENAAQIADRLDPYAQRTNSFPT